MYSQNDEEKHIRDYFKGYQGTLLDIGANDGVTLSNSRYLMKQGWNGVLVEASLNVGKQLSSLYKNNPNATVVNKAVGEKSGTATFYESGTLLNTGDTSLVSTIKKEELNRWPSVNFYEYDVEVITFSQLLDSCKKHIFDFITIDVEGLDYEILKQIDLNKVCCSMLIVENNGKEQKKFVDYCRKYGMKLRAKNAENLIFTQ